MAEQPNYKAEPREDLEDLCTVQTALLGKLMAVAKDSACGCPTCEWLRMIALEGSDLLDQMERGDG